MTCPPDCGWCCTHLVKPRAPDEAAAERAFLAELRTHGVYRCADKPDTGLSLSNEEAARLRGRADERGLRVDLHPRTFLLETRRRRTVVADWHLAHASCPFYADFACTVYEDRPLPCRAYPVLAPGPRWRLAPECPRVDAAAWDGAGESKAAFFRVESKARRALDAAHAALDDAFALTARGDLRFATRLSGAEARRRAARWKPVAMETLVRTVPGADAKGQNGSSRSRRPEIP